MPLYDFHCPDCDTATEILARFDVTPACPKCGGGHLQRLVSGVSPPEKSQGLLKKARAQAAREGHFSNYDH